jgi:hypothetical protein
MEKSKFKTQNTINEARSQRIRRKMKQRRKGWREDRGKREESKFVHKFMK